MSIKIFFLINVMFCLCSHGGVENQNIKIYVDYEDGERKFFFKGYNYIPPESEDEIFHSYSVSPTNFERQKALEKQGYRKTNVIEGLAFIVYQSKDGAFSWPYVYVGDEPEYEPGSLDYEISSVNNREPSNRDYLQYGELPYQRMWGYFYLIKPKSNDRVIMVFLPEKQLEIRFYDTGLTGADIKGEKLHVKVPPIEKLPFAREDLFDFVKDNREVAFLLSFRKANEEEK